MADHKRNHLAIQIECMLANAPPLSTNECSIYRVPHGLCKLNPDAYTPKIVSIGPFHHGDTQLIKMEGLKQMYCHNFIARSETNLDDLVTCLQELEPKVRRCYAENIELSVDELVKLTLVDCCFVLEFLWRGTNSYDQSMPWLMPGITWDLLLLENQLPFFVFEKLYNLAFASSLNCGNPSFMRIASCWVASETEAGELPQTEKIAHFTDLYRYYFLQPSYKLPGREEELLDHLYSATKLKEAGVKFRVNEKSKCFLDLEFSGHCLRIPQFTVIDTTESILRNLVALEQCHYPNESYIIDYVQLLDFLIDTDKDVDVLIKNGIIRNWIGDNNEVAKLFNGLCKNIIVKGSNSNYLRICRDLNAYYEHPWHSSMATLRRDYCNTRWKTLASIAAIILPFLTIIQTVSSIKQVV